MGEATGKSRDRLPVLRYSCEGAGVRAQVEKVVPGLVGWLLGIP